MRLLERNGQGMFSLTKDFGDDKNPPYAILSHTWGADAEEVTFGDMNNGTGANKAGFVKIIFCGEQASIDGLQFFWLDTCWIDKSNSTELSEAINSMFRWYREATKCYVYLTDVPTANSDRNDSPSGPTWEAAFHRSRWFTRGWTLQELIAPVSVEFFSMDRNRLGDRQSLAQHISEITRIPIRALQGSPLYDFSISERISWAENRETKRKEDKAYSLLGLFDVHMPLIYGEGRENAFTRLREEIDKHSMNKTAGQKDKDHSYRQGQSRVCLASLSPINQDALHNRAMTRYQSACRWFLNEPRFHHWRKDSCSDLLYLTASAGCGKTTIAAHIIDTLQREYTSEVSQDQNQNHGKQLVVKNILLHFFFQKVNVDDEGTAMAALRNLISQLVLQMPDLNDLLRQQYDILALKGNVLWSWEPLSAVFGSMIRQLRDRTVSRIYIVLDGVDECSSDSRRNLLECLESLIDDQRISPSNRPESFLKVLITGRPDEEVFDVIPKTKHYEITDSLTAGDIEALIVTGVEQLGNRRHLAPEVQSAIKKFLHINAKGMFLWVVLVLQELDRRDERLTDDLIATRLRRVPLTLSLVYKEILANVPEPRRDDMWRIICCMLTSFRVLSLVELKTALCVEIGIPEWHDFTGDVKQLCGSLVRITNDKVRFVHQSARDFLIAYADGTSAEQIDGMPWQSDEPELQMTTVCLKYLLQEGPLDDVYTARPSKTGVFYDDWMRDVFRKWPLLSYAAKHWALHLESFAQPNPDMIRLTHQLLDNQINRDLLMRLMYYFTHYRTSGTPRRGTQLHIAAYFNLPWFITYYIQQQVDFDEIADCGDTALIWGSETGSTESVRRLLQAGANPNIVEYDGWSPLHWAATNGHHEICSLLLEHGADIDAVDCHGATPGDWAVNRGHDMAAAVIERFRSRGKSSMGRDLEKGLGIPGASPSIANPQWLTNGRLAMGKLPHVYENAKD